MSRNRLTFQVDQEKGAAQDGEASVRHGPVRGVQSTSIMELAMHQGTYHILIVDDERHFAAALALTLQRARYLTTVVHDGRAALDALRGRDTFDLVLLDIELQDPVLDGRAVCQKIRARFDYLPVIMMTAYYESTADQITGLEIGADDYIIKPFDNGVLLARIKARLRVQNRHGSLLHIDDHLQIDAQRGRVYRDGQEIPLTNREYELLLFLAQNAPRPFGRQQLLDAVWGQDYDGIDRTVDSHVAKLRGQVEDDPRNPRYILTVRNFGYKFCDW
jgi:DNA-binding response OmpR family regulator